MLKLLGKLTIAAAPFIRLQGLAVSVMEGDFHD
jgi:hypothetical protein